MTKQELTRDMKAYVGGGAFISPSTLMQYRRTSMGKVRDLLKGLEYDENRKGRVYFIPDVAERIINCMKPGA